MPEDIINQHLIDPELCIRCNTCEETCPIGAISNNFRNYVVDPDVCNGCRACVDPCPTGAINVWVPVSSAQVHSCAEQLQWDSLPDGGGAGLETLPALSRGGRGAEIENLYSLRQPARATLSANRCLTPPGAGVAVHHLVLDLTHQPFPFLEGQSVGILAPGLDSHGKPHPMRLYSVASARTGEDGQAGQLALTVKRVIEDHQGQSKPGVCSNYLCDLAEGEQVQVVGPYGVDFLMPETPGPIVMICTGTGIAPMRAMLQRLEAEGQLGAERLLLFYGGRSLDAMAYSKQLQALHEGYQLDLNLSLSRQPGQPKRYVQDTLIERHDALARCLQEPATHIYICGLKGMEAGVFEALARLCAEQGLQWEAFKREMIEQSRLHIETY